MTTLYASPSRVVIYTDGDTSPETANPPDLSRVKFDTNLEYVRIVRQNTVSVNLPSRNYQTSGNQNPVVLVNWVLEDHGLGYTPLVFGFCTCSGNALLAPAGSHVPLRGTVPIQVRSNNWFPRTVSLGSSATQVILNEYAVRDFFGFPSQSCFPPCTVTVTYYITNAAL